MTRGEETIPKLEGYTVEFKDFSGGVSTKELASTLCAFANTDGGAVYLGVTDLGDRKGLRVTPALLDQVRNAARDGSMNRGIARQRRRRAEHPV